MYILNSSYLPLCLLGFVFSQLIGLFLCQHPVYSKAYQTHDLVTQVAGR